MKIILVHYRHFVTGGPERYMFNIASMLRQKGHEVIHFSIKHKKNLPSEHEDYFLAPVGDGDEVYGHEYRKNFRTVTRVIARMLYSFEARRKLTQVIRKENPDLIYVLQFQNKMSCSIVDAAHKQGIPVVQRLSDFAHMCINNTLYNFQTHDVCERCLLGSKANAVKFKCWQGSLINSTIKTLALVIQDFRGTAKKISAFVVPAQFTMTKHAEHGIDAQKMYHIPTFFSGSPSATPSSTVRSSGEKYFLYFGRLEEEKGLMTLVRAFVQSGFRLLIVGFSGTGYEEILRNYLKDKRHAIEFLGRLDFKDIQPLISGCVATLCPSEWYDNFPNVILESYAGRKPVIATELGSLKELVVDNETGMLFERKNVDDLNRCTAFLHGNPNAAEGMGQNGFALLQREFAAELHYGRLINVFNHVVASSRPGGSVVGAL